MTEIKYWIVFGYCKGSSTREAVMDITGISVVQINRDHRDGNRFPPYTTQQEVKIA
jgi:hypothetical protein